LLHDEYLGEASDPFADGSVVSCLLGFEVQVVHLEDIFLSDHQSDFFPDSRKNHYGEPSNPGSLALQAWLEGLSRVSSQILRRNLD